MIKMLVYLLLLFTIFNQSATPQTVSSITDDIPKIDISSQDIDTSEFDSISNEKNAWGIGKSRDENNQPIDCVKANEQYKQYNTKFVLDNKKEILLTFDNGYENGNTGSILDTLKANDTKAIFFLTGQYVEENAELVQRMIDEGHTIGSHTFHHPVMTDIDSKKLVEEIVSLHNYMLENFQYQMSVIRPPKGEFSEKSLAITQALNYETLLWSFAYNDYDVNNQPNESSSLTKLVDNLHNGEILLLHSVSTTNMNILDDFIKQVKQVGYEIIDYNNK